MSIVFAVYIERFSVLSYEKYQYQLTSAVEDHFDPSEEAILELKGVRRNALEAHA